MKKTYIIPCAFSVQIETNKGLLIGSAHLTGDVDVIFGGDSDGTMSSDVKGFDNKSIWDETW